MMNTRKESKERDLLNGNTIKLPLYSLKTSYAGACIALWMYCYFEQRTRCNIIISLHKKSD